MSGENLSPWLFNESFISPLNERDEGEKAKQWRWQRIAHRHCVETNERRGMSILIIDDLSQWDELMWKHCWDWDCRWTKIVLIFTLRKTWKLLISKVPLQRKTRLMNIDRLFFVWRLCPLRRNSDEKASFGLVERADGSLVVTEAEQEEIVSIIGSIKLKTKVFSLTDLSWEWKCSSMIANRREREDRGQTEEINDEFQQLRNISRRNEQITTGENLDEGNWQYKRERSINGTIDEKIQRKRTGKRMNEWMKQFVLMPSSVTVTTKGKMNEQHRPMHFDKNEKNETKFFRVKECLSHRNDQNEGMNWVLSATNNERDHFSSDKTWPEMWRTRSTFHRDDEQQMFFSTSDSNALTWEQVLTYPSSLALNNIVVAQPSEGNIFFRHCSISFSDADQSDWKMSCTWSLPGPLNIFKQREERNKQQFLVMLFFIIRNIVQCLLLFDFSRSEMNVWRTSEDRIEECTNRGMNKSFSEQIEGHSISEHHNRKIDEIVGCLFRLRRSSIGWTSWIDKTNFSFPIRASRERNVRLVLRSMTSEFSTTAIDRWWLECLWLLFSFFFVLVPISNHGEEMEGQTSPFRSAIHCHQ